MTHWLKGEMHTSREIEERTDRFPTFDFGPTNSLAIRTTSEMPIILRTELFVQLIGITGYTRYWVKLGWRE